MAILDKLPNMIEPKQAAFTFRIIELGLLICTIVYVFAFTEAQVEQNSRDIKVNKAETVEELRYIRSRIDYLIELELRRQDR